MNEIIKSLWCRLSATPKDQTPSTLSDTRPLYWRLRDKEAAGHLKELFHRLDIQCVLDVGANIGQYRDFLRADVGYTGIIISFEPLAHLAKILRRRAKDDPKWIIYDYALGDVNEKMLINVMKTNAMSSFLKPDYGSVTSFNWLKKIKRKEMVTVRSLDEILPELKRDLGIKNIFLKTDTQGWDMKVIEGAGKCLKGILAIQTEMSIKPIYKNTPDYIESIRSLNDRGFEITAMFTISRDDLLRIVEFDCILLNTRKSKKNKKYALYV